MDSSKLMYVALKFNEKINQRDLEGLAELMTEDHTFIDNSGDVTKGKDVMKEGWREFFEKYPDYRNIFTCVTVRTMLLLWSVTPPAPINHSTAQAYGLPKYVADVSPNGEYTGWTKDKSKFLFPYRIMHAQKIKKRREYFIRLMETMGLAPKPLRCE